MHKIVFSAHIGQLSSKKNHYFYDILYVAHNIMNQQCNRLIRESWNNEIDYLLYSCKNCGKDTKK